VTGTPVIVNGGAHGDVLAGALRRAAPNETFVHCGPDDPVPGDHAVLVTLLDDPDAVRRLLRPSVEWVHVLGAGVDGFPFDALGGRRLTCSRGAAAAAIAEWVLAVMLAFEKRLPQSWVDGPPPRWNTASLGGLSGRTLGLVGVGAIGTAVARRAIAFDMEVLACRRTCAPAPVEGIEMVADLHTLLARSDHVVVAAPATPATRHLVGADTLASCRPGLHLVNVARGALVDQEALRRALDDGRVARASLDTVDPEPLPPGHWLFGHDGVRVSPHVSWSAPGTMPATLALFVENLRRYRAGQDLQGLVDAEAGY
jgi:phosphoglycerate dehydrogenase-like enzyme